MGCNDIIVITKYYQFTFKKIVKDDFLWFSNDRILRHKSKIRIILKVKD